MAHTLIIGFGNPDRADDGVAWHVANAVRARLGQPPLSDDDIGEDSAPHVAVGAIHELPLPNHASDRGVGAVHELPLPNATPRPQADVIFLFQLAPELMETLAAYDRVIFVDAHVRADVPTLHVTPIEPDLTSSAFTHHLTPGQLLAWTQAVLGRAPAGYLVSVRGWDFDFHRQLSPQTAAQVGPAAQQVLALLAEDSPTTDERGG